MRAMFAGSEGIEFCPTVVTVKGAPTAETEKALEALAGEIMA